ncbi:hypothetical protein YN1HA_3390 [Sulfurisphaera ohwakuensis]
MSAAAVTPAPRVVGTLTGPKAPVAGPLSRPLKTRAQPGKWGRYWWARGRERLGVLPEEGRNP